MRIDDRTKSSGYNISDSDEVLTITSRTVRFSKTVYQTRNIAAFSEGNVPIGHIPWLIILVCAIGGFFARYYIARGDSSVADFLILFAFGGVLWNLAKPKHYGFLLSLNSGEKKLFITRDKVGIKQVISTLYDFIEEERDATYQITVNNSQIKGNFIQGSTRGDITYR
jgi:Family of unknown function (DUF6232)